jgi:serine/threonine protein kinase
LYNQVHRNICPELFSRRSGIRITKNLRIHASRKILSMEQIGRYKIVSELGRGGMATVYRAIDPSFEREVAVKILPQAFLHDPQFRQRGTREAKMIAALEHAAIVPVYDFGEDQDVPFIVMRMMSGGSLADKLKNDHLSIEEAAQVVIRVAAALDAAHQKGIIHRDLKPGNILFDQYDNAFLSDFGIARLAEAGATLTGSNILGTPAYMSPEQVQGDKDIDGRSDIYAMGVIFYQMLIGNTPYQATTPAKVMMMHILEPVPNLIGTLPEVTPAVEAWFEKTLAKDPDERFATAGDMAAALQAALRDEVQPTQKSKPPSQDLDRTIAAAAPAVITPPRGTRPPAPTSAAAPVPSTPYQSVQTGAPPPSATPPPAGLYPTSAQPQSSGRRWLPMTIVGLGLAGILVIGLIAVVFLGFSGTGPLAMLAAATATPTLTAAPPTPTELPEVLPGETAEPSATPTETIVEETAVPEPTDEPLPPTEALPTDTPEPTLAPTSDALILGGADTIAFIDKNEIYVMNVDGSDLRQLTSDGAEKTRLSWTPDGAEILYISGLCAWSIDYETGRQDYLACFDTAKDLSDFSPSSDGSQVAVVLNQNLYVVPFDRESLLQARSVSDLIALGEACEVLAPLQTSNGTNVIVNHVAWSADDTRMALNVVAPVNGIQSDLIRFTDISSCQYTDTLDEFPSRRLEIDNYDKYPYIQNFGYDGYVLFSLVSYTRNDGFGDLYFYNTSLYRSESKVNPIGGTCCYRDPQFSPDGRYLIFAYQAYDPNATTQLYYAPYATLGTGANLQPIPLPEDMLTDRKAKPQPALRPVPGQ